MTQLGVTNVGMVPLVGFMNPELLDTLSVNSDNSYFNVPGSRPTKNSWQIAQEQIAVTFPHSVGDKVSPGKTKFITDLRGIRGPEIGTDNIKEVTNSMMAAGYSKHTIEKAANHMVLRQAKVVGVTTGGAAYDSDKSSAGRIQTIGFMIRGQAGYTNIEHEKHRVGDLLIADIPTTDELNSIDYRKAQMRGGVREGTIPVILRKYKVRDAVARATADIAMYINDPDVSRHRVRSTNRADVAHMASMHNVCQFALFCAVHGYGMINDLLGLTSVPIEPFDGTRHRTLGGGERAVSINRDVTGGAFTIAKDASEPYAELRRTFYRQPNNRALPVDGAPIAGIIRATESPTIETNLAILTGLIDGSPTSGSDRSNPFSGVVAAQLRADRRLADASATRDPLPGSLLENAQDFTEAMLKGLFYDTNTKTTGSVRTRRNAFGDVRDKDGRFIRNLAMTTNSKSRIMRPNPHTEYGQMLILQQGVAAQGLAAMADMIDGQRRLIQGVATRNQGHLGAGAVMLTHCSY